MYVYNLSNGAGFQGYRAHIPATLFTSKPQPFKSKTHIISIFRLVIVKQNQAAAALYFFPNLVFGVQGRRRWGKERDLMAL